MASETHVVAGGAGEDAGAAASKGGTLIETANRIEIGSSRRAATPPLLAVATLLFLLSGLASAAELPGFRQGKWDFQRTVEGQAAGGKPVTLTNQKCTDPSADMKKMHEVMSKQGCTFSGVAAKGNVYSFSSTCKIQGADVEFASEMTVESDSAYTVDVTSTGGGQSTREHLVAKRVGDCS
jgi:hypothetical protein